MDGHKSYSELSVVISAYNERTTIEELLQRVQAVDIDKEILIVEDGSTDGTREFLVELVQATNRTPAVMRLLQTGYRLRTDNIHIFFQGRNLGKGAVLRRGFQEARGEVIVVQDVDLEYDPGDYHGLLQPIERGVADVVYGSRFLGGPHRVLFFWHYLSIISYLAFLDGHE